MLVRMRTNSVHISDSLRSKNTETMVAGTKVKFIYLVEIFSITLLLSIQHSIARPNNVIALPSNDSPTRVRKEFADSFIENNILNGIVEPITHRTFGQDIFEALKNSPDHVAQIDAQTGKQTTYKEMMDRSVRLALWMKKQGVGPNDTIVVCSHNHLDAYIPLFATFFVDAIFSGWIPETTLYTAQHLIKQFPAKLIFTNEKAADVLLEAVTLEKSNAQLIAFEKHSKMLSLSDIMDEQTQDEVNSFVLVNEKSPEDVGAIILSSGSSGFPKGTMLPNKIQPIPNAYNMPSNAVVTYLWYSTFDAITGFLFTVKAITEKGIRIIPADSSIESFFQMIQKYKVNYAQTPLAIVNDLAKSGSAKKYDLQSLKTIYVSGTKVSKDILLSLQQEIPNAYVGQGYGITEIGLISYTQPRSKHIESAGIVAPNCKIKIVDLHSGEALGPNKGGELYAKTLYTMIGYYNNPNLTRESFDAEGWYRSGDLAYYDESGEMFIVDRIKEIIRFDNYDIYPGEIQEILLSHPDVREAVVVPVPVGLKGQRPVAFISTTPNSNVAKDELMKLISVLEDYKQLKEIYFMDIPRLSSGKIAKAELKELAGKLAKNEEES